ncbi:MAG TPA: SDR family oxidoreductase [Steroidobacteraceae bacterium]|nr:SDR family oxidoreductase [Steroidobacteraceae bacterium]
MAERHAAQNDPFRLDGKVALITGSSRGIGRAIAEQMARAGARVVISSRKLDACETVRDELKARGHEALAIACNVSRREEIDNLVERTLEACGRIDILVANAAANPHYGPLSSISEEAWNKILDTNLSASLWLANRVLPGMAERDGGAMILLSSVSALMGTALIGAYAVSKAAELQLTRNLAMEWGRKGVRVNAIAPGVIQTEFARALWENPAATKRIESLNCIGRLGVPEDVAGAALFLASDASRFITGQTLVIDGGATIFNPLERM